MATSLEAVRELVEKQPTEHSVSCELPAALNKVNQILSKLSLNNLQCWDSVFHTFSRGKGKGPALLEKGSLF